MAQEDRVIAFVGVLQQGKPFFTAQAAIEVVEDAADTFVNDSLLAIFPFVVEAHIATIMEEHNLAVRAAPQPPQDLDDEIDFMRPNSQPLQRFSPLSDLAQDTAFVAAFNQFLESDRFLQALNDAQNFNQGPQTRDFLLRVLYVSEFFRLKRTPTTLASISSAQNPLVVSMVKRALATANASSEGLTLLNVLKNGQAAIQTLFSGSAATISTMSQAQVFAVSAQVTSMTLKNSQAFAADLARQLQPISAIFVPNDNIGVSMTSIMGSVIGSVYPEASGMATFVASLPETAQPILQAFRMDWSDQSSMIRNAVRKSMSTVTIVERGYYKYLPEGERYERASVWNVSEKGEALMSTLINLRYRGGDSPVSSKAGRSVVPDSTDPRDVDKVESPFVWCHEPSNRRIIEESADPLAEISIPGGSSAPQVPPLYRRSWAELLPPPNNRTPAQFVAEYYLGCFVPGTKVWTDNGEAAIEDLRENDRILTRANGAYGQFGIRSDEVVALPIPAGVATLYGFNDQSAFFTSSHVFHTTTGLRAINPIAAKLENPWLDVGKLRVGHTLLHTTDGETYQHVTIYSFRKEVVSCDHVWGVHLREGLRSYHANGFLVHLNYPEITIKSIADLLRGVPEDKRMEMLLHLKELKPLFERYGGGAIEDMLVRELSNDMFLASARHKISAEELPPAPLYFQSRSFKVIFKDEKQVEGVVDSIDALDGVLHINHQPCVRSRILERGVAWSRAISEGVWEHGMCTFGADKQLLNGDGFLWLTPDENPTESDTKPLQFQAQSVCLRSRYTGDFDDDDTTMTGQTSTEVAVFSAAEDVASEREEEGIEPTDIMGINENTAPSFAEEKIEPTDTDEDDIDDFDEWMRRPKELAPPNIDNEFMPKDTESVSNEMGNEAVMKDKEKLAEIVEGPAPRREKPGSTMTQVVDQIWTTKIDSKPLTRLADVKIDKPFLTFSFAELEAIAEEQKRRFSLPEAPQYQASTFVLGQNNVFDVLITIQEPVALALAADDNVSEDAEGQLYPKSYENLRYTLPDRTVELPFIFTKYQFEPNNLAGFFKGKLCKYDPNPDESAEGEGLRYVIEGQLKGSSTRPSVNGEDSRSPAAPSQPGSPAPITSRPNPNMKSVVNLISNLGVSTEQLKKEAAALLYRAMIYHMDRTDREKMTSAVLPKVSDDDKVLDALPSAMAEGLDIDLKLWLKNRYAVAYITNNMFSMTPEQQKEFKSVFTEKDQKRLQYWYRGRGRDCLCRSREYERLNTMATNQAFIRRVPRIKDYQFDLEKSDVPDEKGNILRNVIGGRKWAYLYYYQVSREDYVRQIAEQTTYSELSGNNPLEHHTSIINALWYDSPTAPMSGSKLGGLLAGTVNRYIKENHLLRYALIEDAETMESGLRDLFAAFLDVLLDDEKAALAGFKPQLREKLRDAMMKLIEEKQKLSKESADQQKKSIMLGSAAAIKSMVKYMQRGQKVGSWAGNFVRKVFKKPTAIKTAPKAGPVGPTRGDKITAGLGLALTLVGTAYFLYSSMSSWGQWDELSNVDRAQLITSHIQAAGGLVYGFYSAVYLYRNGAPAAAQFNSAATKALEDGLRKRSTAMAPNLSKEAANPGLRQRNQSVGSRPLGSVVGKPRNVSEALLPVKKPSAWTKFKAALKKDSMVSKIKENVTAFTIRAFAVVLSLVMLVLSVISVISNWDELNTAERWLTVVSLFIAFASLIIEAFALIMAIPGWVTTVIGLVGFIVGIILGAVGGKKEPPKSDVQIFYEDRARPFLDWLSDPPPSTLQWYIANPVGSANSVKTIEIVGIPRIPGGPEPRERLQSVQVAFDTAASGPAEVLFTSTADFQEVDASTQGPEAQETVTIEFRSRYKEAFDTGCLKNGTPGSYNVKWNCLVKQKDYGSLTESFGEGRVPFIDKKEAIIIKIRGKLASVGSYKINVVEQYADPDGTPGEVEEIALTYWKTY